MLTRMLCRINGPGGTANPIRSDVGLARTFRLLRGALLELAGYLGRPGTWLWNFFLLMAFVVAMLPAFVPVFFHYLRSKRIIKNITYGPSIRHQLDVYLPAPEAMARAGAGCPVVIFVSGGAWVIGYKMWSFLMGCVLQQRGILFVSPDYRNFPQGQVPDMVRDVTEAVKWCVTNNIFTHTHTHTHTHAHTYINIHAYVARDVQFFFLFFVM